MSNAPPQNSAHYVIRDVISSGYYTGTVSFGPMFGGSLDEAKRFDSKADAAFAASRFPMMVIWDIEEA